MPKTAMTIFPRIAPWSAGQPLNMVVALLNNVARHVIVRITGGCAGMSQQDGADLTKLFTEAFRGFDGALLIGGTRMVIDGDLNNILPGITEVGPSIRLDNPSSYVLGIIPGLESLIYRVDRLEVPRPLSTPNEPRHTTIVHPDQDLVVAISGQLAPGNSLWDDEATFCRYITAVLTEYGGWESLLISYNGGRTTAKEVLEAARSGRPVLLIRGSGRETDRIASDPDFMRSHPNVRTCDNTAQSLRASLRALSVLDQEGARR